MPVSRKAVRRAKPQPSVKKCRERRTVAAERVEKLRESRGWTRGHLADLVSCQRIRIWRIENGITDVTIEDAAIFAQIFGVSVEYLCGVARAA